MSDNNVVFWSGNKGWILCEGSLRSDGVAVNSKGQTLEMIRQSGEPDAMCGSSAEWNAFMSQKSKEPPKRVDAKRFNDALNILPPCGWVQGFASESFKMSELLFGKVGIIYARIGEKYFRLQDDITMTHNEILARCQPLL